MPILPTILVADDDRSIRTVLTQALCRSGYQVRATGSAGMLWRWVEEGEGDLVITDVVMPDDNGLELLPRIKRARPELRVIVMSAQSTLMTAVKAAQRGAFENCWRWWTGRWRRRRRPVTSRRRSPAMPTSACR